MSANTNDVSANETVSSPRSVVSREAPPFNGEQLWHDAILEAANLSSVRSGTGETLAERMSRLKESLKGEMVAFHDRLDVQPHSGEDGKVRPGTEWWDVKIPITLFPKRDQGFARVECLVEFYSSSKAPIDFRVIMLAPNNRTRVYATAALGGELELHTAAQLGLSMPLPVGTCTTDAQLKLYGSGKANFSYQVERDCTLAEIVRGVGARWRLEDPQAPRQASSEAHQLQATLEVNEGAQGIHAAGCLQAYSEEKWFTMAVGNILSRLGERARAFFAGGAPVVAYGQWNDFLKRGAGS